MREEMHSCKGEQSTTTQDGMAPLSSRASTRVCTPFQPSRSAEASRPLTHLYRVAKLLHICMQDSGMSSLTNHSRPGSVPFPATSFPFQALPSSLSWRAVHLISPELPPKGKRLASLEHRGQSPCMHPGAQVRSRLLALSCCCIDAFASIQRMTRLALDRAVHHDWLKVSVPG